MWPRQRSLRGLWGKHKVLRLLCFSAMLFCYASSEHTFRNQSIQQTHNTWCIHDVEKVRFASGVWKDHCNRGTLDTNPPLWKNSTRLRSPMQQGKKQFYNFNIYFLKMIIVTTRSCNLPSLKSCQNELYASWIICPCLKYLAILTSGNLMYFRMQWSAIVQPSHLPPVLWRGCLCIGANKKRKSQKSYLFIVIYRSVIKCKKIAYYYSQHSRPHHLSSWFLGVFVQSGSPQNTSEQNKQNH